MRREQASFTAAGIALTRAIESSRPADRRVLYDPFARRFIGSAFFWLGKLLVDTGYPERIAPGTSGFLAVRERYIDDYLQASIDAGLDQLVVLGAGYDARAYRFEGLRGRTRVFEVDHPATQRVKMQKLTRILGALPDDVVFVPVDFQTQTLEACLLAAGYRADARTLFIWQGVTMYLTPEAVDTTLAVIAGHSQPGSSVIFDYIYASAMDGTIKRGELKRMQRYRGFTGEALTFSIEEGQIEPFLVERGFRDVRNVPSELLQKKYFTGVNAGRVVAGGYAIVSASVAP